MDKEEFDRREAQADAAEIRYLRDTYGDGPFIAADALVRTRDKKILLIRRGGRPQMGRLAIPGGRVEAGQTLFQTAVNELLQETKMRINGEPVTAEILEEHLDGFAVMDRPDRDPRAHWITKAFFFDLPFHASEIEVEADDDAMKGSAAFYAVENILDEKFYADHEEILVACLYDDDSDGTHSLRTHYEWSKE